MQNVQALGRGRLLGKDLSGEQWEWLKRAGGTKPCKFFKTKNGKNYRCHAPSQLACEHFEEL